MQKVTAKRKKVPDCSAPAVGGTSYPLGSALAAALVLGTFTCNGERFVQYLATWHRGLSYFGGYFVVGLLKFCSDGALCSDGTRPEHLSFFFFHAVSVQYGQ